MKKKSIIIISIAALVFLTIGIILLTRNNTIKEKNKIEVFDATFSCAQTEEKFYEDDKYIYYFPCTKSNSVYVKFANGNKMLGVDALEAKEVTIDELLKAGLDAKKKRK